MSDPTKPTAPTDPIVPGFKPRARRNYADSVYNPKLLERARALAAARRRNDERGSNGMGPERLRAVVLADPTESQFSRDARLMASCISDGDLTATSVASIIEATGLSRGRIRQLARELWEHPDDLRDH